MNLADNVTQSLSQYPRCNAVDLKEKRERVDEKAHLAIAPLADGFQEIKVIWDQLLLPTGIHHLV